MDYVETGYTACGPRMLRVCGTAWDERTEGPYHEGIYGFHQEAC